MSASRSVGHAEHGGNRHAQKPLEVLYPPSTAEPSLANTIARRVARCVGCTLDPYSTCVRPGSGYIGRKLASFPW